LLFTRATLADNSSPTMKDIPTGVERREFDSIGAVMMLHLDLDGRYTDLMGLSLFNGSLTGLARDGRIASIPICSRAAASTRVGHRTSGHAAR
jgi:hypothetical protein